jgi:creatinine amidohydrolase
MVIPADLQQRIASLAGAPALRWDERSWPEIQAIRDGGGRMLLLPVGAIEQHGPHLPVNVDAVFAESFCCYASARTGVPVLPAITYACSLGHTDRWPGTISLMPETLSLIVREIAGFLVRTGFEKLLIVNSHWGNTSSLRCAIDRIRFEHAGRFSLGLRNTFEITPAVWRQFTDDAEDFHANRAETALMRFLLPASVREDRIEDDPDRTAGRVFTYVVPQTSTSGLTGRPSLATAEDGRRLFLEIGEALAGLVRSAAAEHPPLDWSRPALS